MIENNVSVGIDGCKHGWVIVIIQNKKYSINLIKSLSELDLDRIKQQRIFIDMPIGLPDKNIHRTLENEMRKILKPHRHSSVFNCPCREALDCDNHNSASETNKKILYKGLSIQSYNIFPKIRELDKFLRSNNLWINTIFESHPEICFQTLNRGPLLHSKKSTEGINERLQILQKYDSNTVEIFNSVKGKYTRKNVALDDILDAICLALSAQLSLSKEISLILNIPKKDAKDIPMRIGYYFPE